MSVQTNHDQYDGAHDAVSAAMKLNSAIGDMERIRDKLLSDNPMHVSVNLATSTATIVLGRVTSDDLNWCAKCKKQTFTGSLFRCVDCGTTNEIIEINITRATEAQL